MKEEKNAKGKKSKKEKEEEKEEKEERKAKKEKEEEKEVKETKVEKDEEKEDKTTEELILNSKIGRFKLVALASKKVKELKQEPFHSTTSLSLAGVPGKHGRFSRPFVFL